MNEFLKKAREVLVTRALVESHSFEILIKRLLSWIITHRAWIYVAAYLNSRRISREIS